MSQCRTRPLQPCQDVKSFLVPVCDNKGSAKHLTASPEHERAFCTTAIPMNFSSKKGGSHSFPYGPLNLNQALKHALLKLNSIAKTAALQLLTTVTEVSHTVQFVSTHTAPQWRSQLYPCLQKPFSPCSLTSPKGLQRAAKQME